MLGLYSMLECMFWNFITAGHGKIWIVFYVEDCGVSSADCHVRLEGVERIITLESFVVCIVGKMAQDVGMVESIVVSFPSSLVGF